MITRRRFLQGMGLATLGASIAPACIDGAAAGTESATVMEEFNLIKPQGTTDGRRYGFDIQNGVIVYNKVPVEFVFLGDSITEWWELGAYFRPRNGIMVNRGSAGDVSRNLKRRFEADVVQLRPKNVVVLIGINNPYQEEYPSQQPHDRIVSDLKQDVDEMIVAARDAGIGFFLCSVLPMSTSDIEMKKLIVKMNDAYKDLAEKHGVVYVDYHSSWVQDDGLSQRSGLTEDTVHPVVFGYNIMAEVLREALAGHGIEI